MSIKKEEFVSKLKCILTDLKMNINYQINETNDDYNILYVNKEKDVYIFNINLEKIDINNLDIFIYHELYHVKQYIDSFPMLVLSSNKSKYSIVQKIITDFYVTKQMMKDGYFDKAYNLFEIRFNSMIQNNFSIKNMEDIYRISYILVEAKVFFNEYYREEILKLNNRFLANKIIEDIYQIIQKNYEKDDILKMYKELIKKIDPKVCYNIFNNYIFII